MKNDTKLFMDLPPVQVDAVAAYRSYAALSRDLVVDNYVEGTPSPNGVLGLFGVEFLVPSDNERSDEDLLKQALELANLEETKLRRQLFHRWRRNMITAGEPAHELQQHMEEAIQQYRSATRRLKIVTATKYAFAIASTGLSAAAFAVPLLGIPGAFFGLGSFVLSESGPKAIPEKLKFAAMFYDARKRFGWYG